MAKQKFGRDEAVNRDIQLDKDVGEMASMGKFGKEFAVYGYAYLDNAQEKYVISVKPENIYDSREALLLQGYYPSSVLEIHERHFIPSGMQETITSDTKFKLAKKLRMAFPNEFLSVLSSYGKIEAVNTAAPLLWKMQEYLDGIFDIEKLHMFENLLNLAIVSKVLQKQDYLKLQEWLSQNYKDIEEDMVEKSEFSKVFYGICYINPKGKLEYLTNALRERVYYHKYELEKKGVIASPVLKKAFFYSYEYPLVKTRQDYFQYLQATYNLEYMHFVQRLKELPNSIPTMEFLHDCKECERKYGAYAKDVLQYYKYLWNIK